MDKITFFHCADLHLDTPFRVLASKPGLPVMRRKEIFSGLTRLIEKVKSENPEFLFIPGDLFEHEYTGLRTVSAVNGLFSSVPDTKVVMIAGNHDPEAANSHYRTYKWNDNVTFIGGDRDSIYFEDKNTEVFGLGWVSGTGQATKLETMELNKERINILLFHGDMDLQIGNNDYNSISSHLLKSKGFNYVAAGHNHKRKTGEGGGIFYNPGSLEPLGFDEPGPHGYFFGTVQKSSLPDVNFCVNAETSYETMQIDISEFEEDEQIVTRLKPLLKPKGVLYKVVLTGSKPLDYNPDPAHIEKGLNDTSMFVKVRDESSVSISIEELSVIKGLKGNFVRNILEQMEIAEEEGKVVLGKALYYGIEAIDNGKIERAGGEDL